jgi:peptidyl-prolyl cis-trans isomerase SurA
MKRSMVLVLSVGVGCQSGAPAPLVSDAGAGGAEGTTHRPVVARVEGVDLQRHDLEVRLEHGLKRRRDNDQKVTEAFITSSRVALLRHMIEAVLFEQEARRNRLEVSDKELELAVARFRERFPEQELFQRYLESVGRSYDAWRGDHRAKLLREKVLRFHALEVTVSDAAVAQRYEKSKDRYRARTKYRVARILLPLPNAAAEPDAAKRAAYQKGALKRARALLLEVRKPGASFTQLAKTHSRGVARSRGGDLGWVRKGVLPEAIDKAVFGAKKGDILGPLVTPAGVHVVKIHDHRASRQRPLAEVSGEIRRAIERKEIAKVRRAILDRLHAAASVEIFDPRLRGASPNAGNR